MFDSPDDFFFRLIPKLLLSSLLFYSSYSRIFFLRYASSIFSLIM